MSRTSGRPSGKNSAALYFPLEIGQLASGKEVYELVTVIRKKHGMRIGQMIEKLEEDGFEILKIFGGTRNLENPQSTYKIFLEASGVKNVDLLKLKEKFSLLDPNLEMYVWGPNQLLVDTHGGQLLAMGVPSVLAGPGVVGEIERAVENLGPKGVAALHWGGVRTAIGQLDRFREELSLVGLKKDQMFLRIVNLAQCSGWGIFETNFDKKDSPPIEVAVRNSFEALSHRGRSQTPVCHLLTGYLSGLTTAIYRTQLTVFEEQCLAQPGKKELCKFVFQRNK